MVQRNPCENERVQRGCGASIKPDYRAAAAVDRLCHLLLL